MKKKKGKNVIAIDDSQEKRIGPGKKTRINITDCTRKNLIEAGPTTVERCKWRKMVAESSWQSYDQTTRTEDEKDGI